MATTFQLTSTQRSDLEALRSQALALGSNAVGAWTPFYEYLAKLLRNKGLPEFQSSPNAGVTPSQVQDIRLFSSLPTEEIGSLVWLLGGAAVNASTGVYSSVIRNYNVRQGQLRDALNKPCQNANSAV